MRRLALAALLLALPLPALAHPGGAASPAAGFVAGFLHPFGGWDHVAAMLALGAWAAMLGGRAAWLLPLGFGGAMALGWALGGAGGVGLPGVEAGILASVFVLGALVAAAARPPLGAALAGAALFGLFHGHAHGTEGASAAGLAALGHAAGFLLAAALLAGAGGVLAGRLAEGPRRRAALRAAGAAAALLPPAALLLG